MEEADLLKERLQAITDKRRIQESIATKRREIEEEKLKLQYIKKKALREQWLMDGLGQQSEEEQEAMRVQAQDEQQQSNQLQTNILRIEKEIEALETQELNISANEEAVLKRLKEVEKTTEDIIKDLNADFHTDLTQYDTWPLSDISSFILPVKTPPPREPISEEPKKATFVMEISVEHDKRTGKSQVVSTATVAPDTLHERGLKVYEDGRKSVYALHPHGGNVLNGAVGEMTPTEVEELLEQAVDQKVPTEVQYHRPVYSAPYSGTSRPSTPRTPNKTPNQTPAPSPSPFQTTGQTRNSAKFQESPRSQDLDGWKTPSKTPSPSFISRDHMSKDFQRPQEESTIPYFHIPRKSNSNKQEVPQPNCGARDPGGLANSKGDVSSPNPASLVSIKARSDGMPALMQPVYRDVDNHSPSHSGHKPKVDPDLFIERLCNLYRNSPFCAGSTSPTDPLREELGSEPVTMIFMGYENAEDEGEDIQAELVIIGEDDDDQLQEDQYVQNNSDEVEGSLSFHPEGYRSKVFQPKVGYATVTSCREQMQDACTIWDDLGFHKPTFMHKPGKNSPYLQGQGMDETANTGSISMEEMKLCSTGR